jgi:hypothetical protein
MTPMFTGLPEGQVPVSALGIRSRRQANLALR